MHRALAWVLLAGVLMFTPSLGTVASAEAGERAAFTVQPEGTIETHGPTPQILNTSLIAGQRVTWQLNLTEAYTVLDVVLQDALNITVPHQAVPWLDGRPFREAAFDPSQAQAPARIYNLSGTPANLTLHLGLPGPGHVNLTVEADTRPPTLLAVETRNLTPPWEPSQRVPVLVTTTDEPALGRLVIPLPDGDTYEKATTVPALEQRYRLTGLKAETPYTYTVAVTDLAGQRTAANGTFTTPAPPTGGVNVTIHAPAGGAQLPQGPVTVTAQLTDQDGTPLRWTAFNVFLDKRPVTDQATVNGSLLELGLDDLAIGEHQVVVEAVTGPGERVHDAVRFTVAADPATIPLPGLVGLLAVLAGAARRPPAGRCEAQRS